MTHNWSPSATKTSGVYVVFTTVTWLPPRTERFSCIENNMVSSLACGNSACTRCTSSLRWLPSCARVRPRECRYIYYEPVWDLDTWGPSTGVPIYSQWSTSKHNPIKKQQHTPIHYNVDEGSHTLSPFNILVYLVYIRLFLTCLSIQIQSIFTKCIYLSTNGNVT